MSDHENFVDVFGPQVRFVWQFHQGDGPVAFTACRDSNCSVDFTLALDRALILGASDGFARAEDGRSFASLERLVPIAGGDVSGSITWHIERTDWGGLRGRSVSEPMTVTGLLNATDVRGRTFIAHKLEGTGTFHSEAVKRGAGIAFTRAEGDFSGTITPVRNLDTGTGGSEPTAMPEPAAGALVVLGLAAIGLVRRFSPRRA